MRLIKKQNKYFNFNQPKETKMSGKNNKLLRRMNRSDKSSKRVWKSLNQHERAKVRNVYTSDGIVLELITNTKH